jgi:hypothetical protein
MGNDASSPPKEPENPPQKIDILESDMLEPYAHLVREIADDDGPTFVAKYSFVEQSRRKIPLILIGPLEGTSSCRLAFKVEKRIFFLDEVKPVTFLSSGKFGFFCFCLSDKKLFGLGQLDCSANEDNPELAGLNAFGRAKVAFVRHVLYRILLKIYPDFWGRQRAAANGERTDRLFLIYEPLDAPVKMPYDSDACDYLSFAKPVADVAPAEDTSPTENDDARENETP